MAVTTTSAASDRSGAALATVSAGLGAHPAKAEQAEPEHPDATRERVRLQKRSLWKQSLACASVQALHFMTGVCMAYSSSLIPALEADDSEIPVTRRQSAWLASSMVLAVPVGSAFSLTVNNCMGRLTLVRSMAIPFCTGWVLIATATTFEQLVVGRFCTGFAVGISHSPSLLFITEVATKSIRGGLGAMATATASLGIVICYVMGAYLPWRTHAWTNCAVPLIPLALQFALAVESPVWLRSRNRAQAAARASAFYYNDAAMVRGTTAWTVLSAPNQDEGKGKGSATWRRVRLLFADPLGFKPLALINVVFLLQQIVGVYVTIYYAVPFLAETGSTIDPYMATILIGVVRLVGCFTVSGLMTRYGRRTLMTISSVGQAVSMAVSGYATLCILQEPGSVSSLWVVGGLLGYIALGCLGWQTIPWSMMAELFPHEVRSLAQPLNSATAHLLMFSMLQLYPALADLVGTSANVQFLFSGMSVLAGVFVVVFLPETRGRTLPEIEEYFRNNVVFLTERRRRRAARRQAAQDALTASGTTAAVV